MTKQGAAPLIDHLAVEWHVGQRAPKKSKKRTQLLRGRKRLEKKLRKAGVRLLRAWEAEPLSQALQQVGTPFASVSDASDSGGTTSSAARVCSGPKKHRKLCCRKAGPDAEGCHAKRRRTHRDMDMAR